MLGASTTALDPAEGDAGVVVDTVGAGDTFDAGLVAGLVQGLDLRGALRLAVAAGTLSVRTRSAAPTASRISARPPAPPVSWSWKTRSEHASGGPAGADPRPAEHQRHGRSHRPGGRPRRIAGVGTATCSSSRTSICSAVRTAERCRAAVLYELPMRLPRRAAPGGEAPDREGRRRARDRRRRFRGLERGHDHHRGRPGPGDHAGPARSSPTPSTSRRSSHCARRSASSSAAARPGPNHTSWSGPWPSRRSRASTSTSRSSASTASPPQPGSRPITRSRRPPTTQ